MVFYSRQSEKDLNSIFSSLITWKKLNLSYDHAVTYHNAIVDVCDKLDRTSYHTMCVFTLHKRYGKYVYNYRRNRNTNWYIIYNKDKNTNIYIQRIISNHITTSDKN